MTRFLILYSFAGILVKVLAGTVEWLILLLGKLRPHQNSARQPSSWVQQSSWSGFWTHGPSERLGSLPSPTHQMLSQWIIPEEKSFSFLQFRSSQKSRNKRFIFGFRARLLRLDFIMRGFQSDWILWCKTSGERSQQSGHSNADHLSRRTYLSD